MSDVVVHRLPDFKNLHISVPGDKSDVDLPHNDSSSQVPAKRRRSQTCSSSTVRDMQPQTDKRLMPETSCPSECSESPQELQASIDYLLPEKQLQQYDIPYEQSLKNPSLVFSRNDDLYQEKLQQHPQTLNPVEPRQECLDKLLKDCQDEEMESTQL